MLRREGPLFPGGLPAEGWQGLLLEDSQGRDHGYLSWTRVPERDDGVGLEVHEALGRTRADRSELLRSLGSWSTVTELVRVRDRKSTRLNSSHVAISYAVFCLKK